ncbi:MAG: VPLPA-CTERM-specific exosortase XrtD [Pseudomonadales bacterium]
MNGTNVFLRKEFFLFLASVALLGWVCLDGLQLMVKWWERDEYSHGYMIPFVALYLAWQRRSALAAVAQPGSPLGIFVLVGALAVWLLGEISAIYTIIQYAFWIGVWGLALLWVGVSGVKIIWAALFYLVFMIPLPNFLYFNLSQELQLISSSLGVAVIRLFDISVFLEGNVIDLGVYQLQVVEACSGLRYLFPLMSFGFLIAYIYKGPFWQRVVIFLSTIPITVLMNSFRIGVIGVTVEHFGIAAAEGFLHDFEGWIVFMACLGVLLVEIWLLHFFTSRKSSFASLFDLDFGAGMAVEPASTSSGNSTSISTVAIAGALLLVCAVPAASYIAEREDQVPDRQSFALFPLKIDEWKGTESALEQNVLDTLKLTDYFMGDYARSNGEPAVNFYVAWYEEQRKGASIHSPKSCLPGGGWEIQRHEIVPVADVEFEREHLMVNRVVMQMAEHKQLVYYWFQGRGRNITNEYLAKWYIFWDSLTRSRTDGALVRLVTYIPEGSDIELADRRMQDFLVHYQEKLPRFVPN